jgi:hypothetical protein
MIESFQNYEDIHTGEDFLIMGAGASIGEYGDKINDLVEVLDLQVIGINNMTDICVPEYHLWTNRGRLDQFGGNILRDSRLIIKKTMDPDVLRKHNITDYVSINYIDEEGESIAYNARKGRVSGHFRTAGCLGIYLAYLMGGRDIYVAGMDGYTYFNPSEIMQDKDKGQHHYGKGLTDHNDKRSKDEYWKDALHKDKLVQGVLDSLCDAGVDFSIITPTVFEEYYDPDVIGE